MKPSEAAALLAALSAAFPEFQLSGETLQLYSACLVDADAEHAGRAVATWILRERRFPRIAELRDRIERERGGSPPDIDQAWKEAMTAARSGRVPPRGWSHPAIRAAVEAVGFNDLRMTNTPGVERAHFEKAYVAASTRHRDAAAPQLVQALMPTMRDLMAAPAVARALSAPQRALPQAKEPDKNVRAAEHRDPVRPETRQAAAPQRSAKGKAKPDGG